MNTSAMKAQFPSISPAHDGGSAVRWHWVTETYPYSICSVQNFDQPNIYIEERQGAQGLLQEWKVLLKLCFEIQSV